MNRQQAFKILALSSAAFALQGCVAAVVPIAAGGLMGGSQVVGDRDDDERVARATDPAPTPIPSPAPTPAPAPAPAPVAAPEPVQEVAAAEPEPDPKPEPEPVLVQSLDDESAAQPAMVVADPVDEPAEAAAQDPVPVLVASLPEEPEAPPPPPVPDPAPDPAPEPEEQAQPTRLAMAEIAPSAKVEAPAPVPAPAPEPQAAPQREPLPALARPSAGSSVSVTLFDPLVSYAASPEFQTGEGRQSAALVDATSLNPDRAKCDSGAPTVLIDLDPAGEPLALDENLTAPGALGVKLAQLRAAGISIAWVSGQPASNETAVRRALRRSGLDLIGNDRLVLVKDPSDRKQTLRDAVAGTSCLVAIAGDTRSDFHELFDYLRNPSDANALQPMFGNGWFIIPTPLLPEGS